MLISTTCHVCGTEYIEPMKKEYIMPTPEWMSKDEIVDYYGEPTTSEAIDQDWVCGECGEYRPDDGRVEAGMKCGHCAYAGAEMVSADDY